jgi:CBS-domain-containing membrane protein
MIMQVKDVMTRNVISVGANEPILKAVRLMLQNRISGLPVIDATAKLVGIVTEGDFLRRSEIGINVNGRNGSNSWSDPDGWLPNTCARAAEGSMRS